MKNMPLRLSKQQQNKAYDAEVMLHNPGTDLTSTATGTGKLIEGTPFDGMPIRVVVPACANADNTLAVTIQESDVLGSGYTTTVTFDTISGAVTAQPGIYRRWVSLRKKYVRSVATVAGTTPNYGKVQIGFDTGGEQKT